MGTIPGFTVDGLLPVGDYALTLDELRASILVLGSRGWSGRAASESSSRANRECVHDPQ
jgi:hypothetical protein